MTVRSDMGDRGYRLGESDADWRLVVLNTWRGMSKHNLSTVAAAFHAHLSVFPTLTLCSDRGSSDRPDDRQHLNRELIMR